MSEHSYGTVTVGVPGDSHDLEIIDFIRARYTDDRLISVLGVEDGSTVVMVENPESSGRAVHQNMRLSKESLIGILSTIMLYYSAKHVDLLSELKDASERNKIDYSASENLDLPFNKDTDAGDQTAD